MSKYRIEKIRKKNRKKMINTEARESHDKNCNFAEKTAILPNELKLGCPLLILKIFFSDSFKKCTSKIRS